MSEDTAHVSRALLRNAARACLWPAVAAGGALTFRGRECWESVLARATPLERWKLLQALETELLAATPNARKRLAVAIADDLDTDPLPCTYGDREGLPLLRQALSLMPARVRGIVVRESAWLFVGRSSVAWTSSSTFVGDDGRPKRRVVVVGPAAGIETCLHEAAHLLHAPTDDGIGCAITADGEAGLRALAVEQKWEDAIEAHDRVHEALAHALARLWLIRSPEGSRPA